MGALEGGSFETQLKQKVEQKTRSTSSPETTLVKCFKYFDLNGNGTVECEEFRKAVEKLGVTFDFTVGAAASPPPAGADHHLPLLRQGRVRASGLQGVLAGHQRALGAKPAGELELQPEPHDWRPLHLQQRPVRGRSSPT